jgi:DNA-binding transcriptional LysR family regulator
MSSDPGLPTLDQLRVFLAVVDVGSFAGAARTLNRATSVISYTVANLEAQLGVQLFDRKSTRKPQLTEAGRMVVAEARTVAKSFPDAVLASCSAFLNREESRSPTLETYRVSVSRLKGMPANESS